METMEKKTKDNNSAVDAREAGDKQETNKVWFLISLLFFAAAILCLGLFGYRKYSEYRAQKDFEQLAQQTDLTISENTPQTILQDIAEPIREEDLLPTPEPTAEPEEVIPVKDPIEVLKELGVPIPEDKVVDFAKLQTEVNADIYAWIYVPGTNVDYPVLRHPTDNGFYLGHNLDGSKGYPGCIYTENYNSMDWTDPVTVLYGHDMRSTGTMFHQLHKFEKQDFFSENEYIYIYTPDKLLVYHIFAAEVHSDEHLLLNHDFEDREVFASFFENAFREGAKQNLVRENLDLEEDSKVITLSTCIKNKSSNRFLIHGVLLND